MIRGFFDSLIAWMDHDLAGIQSQNDNIIQSLGPSPPHPLLALIQLAITKKTIYLSKAAIPRPGIGATSQQPQQRR